LFQRECDANKDRTDRHYYQRWQYRPQETAVGVRHVLLEGKKSSVSLALLSDSAPSRDRHPASQPGRNGLLGEMGVTWADSLGAPQRQDLRAQLPRSWPLYGAQVEATEPDPTRSSSKISQWRNVDHARGPDGKT
jgi:hypothetical protein